MTIHVCMHIPETQFKVYGKMGEPIGLGRGGLGYVRGVWEGNGGASSHVYTELGGSTKTTKWKGADDDRDVYITSFEPLANHAAPPEGMNQAADSQIEMAIDGGSKERSQYLNEMDENQ